MDSDTTPSIPEAIPFIRALLSRNLTWYDLVSIIVDLFLLYQHSFDIAPGISPRMIIMYHQQKHNHILSLQLDIF